MINLEKYCNVHTIDFAFDNHEILLTLALRGEAHHNADFTAVNDYENKIDSMLGDKNKRKKLCKPTYCFVIFEHAKIVEIMKEIEMFALVGPYFKMDDKPEN